MRIIHNGLIWFTADTHFGHANILKHCPHRSACASSAAEMDEFLIAEWNKVVGENDIVFHLGDFAFSNRARIMEIIRRLNGLIYLVPGNHDRPEYFTSFHGNPMRVLGSQVEVSLEDLSGRSVTATLNHFPMVVWNKSHFGTIQLHGHCHGSLDGKIPGKRLDVGVDSSSVLGRPAMRPVSLEEVATAADRLVPWKPDHHDQR